MNMQEVFRKMCLTRYFELEVAEAFNKKLIPGNIYLSVGQEAPSAVISTLTKGYSVFTQHRGHSVYLAHGGRLELIIDELLGLETGCCKGRGGAPCVQDLDIPMYGHHGLIGENIPLATGYALSTKNPTVVYFGDAAAEEDYALTSFGFASTHKLPVLYVCEDNDLSILTPIKDRRNWNVTDVAAAMGLKVASIEDKPDEIFKAVKDLVGNLPAFINIKTCRHLWHSGVGVDGPPAVDRLKELRSVVDDSEKIEEETKNLVRDLWDQRSQILLKK